MIDFLKNIFFYSEEFPLIFTQFHFWAFFAIVLFFYSFLYRKKNLRHAFLFLMSIFFYYKTSGFYFLLLLFSTVTDYIIGNKIHKLPDYMAVRRKIWLTVSICLNLFVLSYFKYSYFYIDSVNAVLGTDFQVVDLFAKWMNNFAGTHFDVDKIILPVGISFFTFQTISYTVDIYRKKILPVKNIIDFGFYVSFFPQLVAGPIVRANEFVPQLYKDYTLSKKEFGFALFLILKGLTKKIVLGDYIAIHFIDKVFSAPLSYSGFENLMALYGYSLQVYADFSGYTDMAIGIALLLGFRLPENFNSPYKALHLGEFWRRWHISLSTWLKDYLYIPLGGNRKASLFSYIASFVFIAIVAAITWHSNIIWLRVTCVLATVLLVFLIAARVKIHTNLNLMITMLLGGLWHGASWQFVIWGGLNGAGLVGYKLWRKISPFRGKHNWKVRFYAIFLTFNFITFTRIWFRSESMQHANELITQITNNFQFLLIPAMIWAYKIPFLIILIGFIIHWLPETVKNYYTELFIKMPDYIKIVIAVITVFLVYQAKSADFQPFIYFQF